MRGVVTENDATHTMLLVWLWLADPAGIASIPLETHEVYVLGTARNMEASGDWVLPRFNDDCG
jgi:hypothetical protein